MKRVTFIFFLICSIGFNLEAHNLPGSSTKGVLKGKIVEEGFEQKLSGVKVIVQ
jgi:hypothetical protein